MLTRHGPSPSLYEVLESLRFTMRQHDDAPFKTTMNHLWFKDALKHALARPMAQAFS